MNNQLIFIFILCVSCGKIIGFRQSFIEAQISSLTNTFQADVPNNRFRGMLEEFGPEFMTTLIDAINGNSNTLEMTLNLLSNKYHDVSQECRQNIMDLVKSLTLGPKGWGWKFIDAIGKFPSGLIKINWIWAGDYHQCINMKVDQTQITTNKSISGRYCFAKVLMPKILPKNVVGDVEKTKSILGFGIGTCFPTSCSTQDVQLLFDLTFGTEIKTYVDEDFCSTTEGHKMDAVAIILTVIVSIPILLVILTTILKTDQTFSTANNYMKTVAVSLKQGRLWPSLCYIFSGRNSYASLVPSTTLVNGENAVTCIYGIRISLMILAIWVHNYTLRFSEFPWKNLLDYASILDHPRLHYAGQSFPIMQIFFLMSGFCLVLSSYGSAQRNIGSFSIIRSYIFRYIRMMPLYLYIAAFNAGPFYYLSNGPMWASAKVLQFACRNNWMRRFLNFENYFHLHHFENDCVTGEYYFGVDWQLYLLGVPVVWLLLRKPRKALAIIITIMICITIALALLAIFIENFHLFYYVPKRDAQHPFPGSSIAIVASICYKVLKIYLTSRKDHYMVVQVYHGFWSRLPGFGMGMMTGYFLARHGNKAKISNRMYTFGWILFWISNITLELYGQFFFQAQYVPKFWVVVYSFFSNLMFPATWCFLIIYCFQFPTCFANKFLSLGIFQVLGKITFPMYVVQISVLFWYYSSAIEPGNLDYYTKVYDFVIIAVVCIILSFILHFVIESPLDRFLKLIKGKSTRAVKISDC